MTSKSRRWSTTSALISATLTQIPSRRRTCGRRVLEIMLSATIEKSHSCRWLIRSAGDALRAYQLVAHRHVWRAVEQCSKPGTCQGEVGDDRLAAVPDFPGL